MQIVCTEGKTLEFPDILSRNISSADGKFYQLEPKVIPKDIKFHINGKKLTILFFIKMITTQQLSTVIHLLLKSKAKERN